LSESVGLAKVEVDILDIDLDGSVFAARFIGGVSFAVAHSVAIDLQYRYFVTEDPRFDVNGVGWIEAESITCHHYIRRHPKRPWDVHVIINFP
jgi:opacity protein-like surface antigen